MIVIKSRIRKEIINPTRYFPCLLLTLPGFDGHGRPYGKLQHPFNVPGFHGNQFPASAPWSGLN